MTSEKTKSTLVAKILDQRKSELLDLLQCYLAMGDDINVRADNGERPLHAACESGQVATVQYLCEHFAVLDWQDNNGNTALHVAVSNGHLDVTRVLEVKGAILNAADNTGSTPLHIAAKGGYLNIVQYFTENFAPIDRRDAKKETAILVAAGEGNEKIVRVLVEQGAEIGVRDIEGKTAFDVATEKCYVVVTELLRYRAERKTIVCSREQRIEKPETDETPEDTVVPTGAWGLIFHQAKPRWTRRGEREKNVRGRRKEDSKSSVVDLGLGMRS